MPTPGVTENVNKTLILRAGNCLWGKHLDKLLGETHESGYDKTQEGFVWGWDFLKGRIRSEVEGEEEAGEKASKMEKASMGRGDQPHFQTSKVGQRRALG